MHRKLLSVLSCILIFPLMLPMASLNEKTYEPEYESMADYTYIITNSYNYDNSYIYRNTGQVGSSWRICNNDAELVYKFDLTQYDDAELFVKVAFNYLLEASSTDGNFTTVADYSKISSKRATDSSNAAIYCINPKALSCTDTVYIRLSNNDNTQYQGGAILYIMLKQMVKSTDRLVINYGRLDNDENITASDALLALQHSVKRITLDEKAALAADVNGDGQITAADALLILQKSVSKISAFPAEIKEENSKVLKDGNTLLFIGDSITDCERDRTDDTNFGYPYSYTNRIREMLPVLYPDKTFKILNRGYSGSTSQQLYNLFLNDSISTKPDVVTVLVGINDVVSGQVNHVPISTETYKANLKKIVSVILNVHAIPVIMSPFVFPAASGYTDGWRDEVEEKIAAAKEVAGEFDVTFIALDDIFTNEWDAQNNPTRYASGDGVHLVDYGHQIVATEWINAVASLGD